MIPESEQPQCLTDGCTSPAYKLGLCWRCFDKRQCADLLKQVCADVIAERGS